MKRRTLGLASLGWASLGLAASPVPLRCAQAQPPQGAWPSRSVRWQVGYGAGGASDMLARLVGGVITERTTIPVVVENRPSGGAIVATENVVRSAADGYTLLQVDNAVMVYNPALYTRLPFDPDADLAPVAFVGRFPLFVLVRRDSPHRSFADLLAASRRASVTYGTPSVASPHHLGMELLKIRSGLEATHVPFRGTPPAVQDMLAGRIDCMMCDGMAALPLLASGDARALLAAHGERLPYALDVPTARELGFDAVAPGWQGVCVAAATPAPVREMIESALASALAAPKVTERLATLGAERPAGGVREFLAYIRQERALWRPLIRELGLRMDS
ncbi:tripartite tricarboxylate transporter substrate binding protein [Roseomonas sp. GC11]|uniref:Bug family tripartite tricarboxylate transporter substrate binding protein n=1 Tax=Roseomonas sp. GC11 TaxID=2950546 RepID=UPI0021090641|nr:tripartite tricarboxylate transporter substrate binding protein [Roseomonas sp. GC11]MCQ4159890.1 tripartite tricarboxylate transporter substrate binding protein [Roseomonas sp. GC11]